MKKLLLLTVLLCITNANAQIIENYPSSLTLQNPSNYIAFNNKLYYFARNASYEIILFSTDGTDAGNQVVKNFGFSFSTDLNDENEYNERKIIFNNTLFFSFAGSLYKSDGTTAGTSIVLSSLFNVKYFQVYNNKVYFVATSGSLGSELWSTDGTAAGTTLVKDINPGTANGFNSTNYNPHLTVFNNKLFFVANDGVNGYELWSTDGTGAGTSLLKDIRPTDGTDPIGYGGFVGNGGYSKVPFKILGNKMYFGANPSQTNGGLPFYMVNDSFVLYATDGTAAGTNFVQPPLPNSATCSCGNQNYNYIYNLKGLTVYNNKLYVYGNQAYHSFGGIQNGGIYVVDGSSPVTRLFAFWDYNGDVGTSSDTERYSMRLYNSEFYFLAYTYASGDKTNLWKMNPATNTFTQMTQTPPSGLTEFSESGIDLRLLVAKEFNGRLFFVKTRPSEGKIFSTDGTIAGTQFEARNVQNGGSVSLHSTQAMTVIPNLLFGFGNAIYFKAQFQGAPAATLQRLRFTGLSNPEVTTSNFKIYPNPTEDILNISYTEPISKVEVFNIIGKQVFSLENNTNEVQIDLANLASGTYLVKITADDKVKTVKVIKK